MSFCSVTTQTPYTGIQLIDRQDWTSERHPMVLETSVPGIFAAGDVRSGSVKRVASAVGEGAIIISQVHQFLSEQTTESLLPP